MIRPPQSPRPPANIPVDSRQFSAHLPRVRLRTRTVDDLHVDDERSFEHIALYGELKRVLREDGFRFHVPAPGSADARWDRVVFLNLTFWSAAQPVELLVDDHLAPDVLMHVAWHHLTRRALFAESGQRPSPAALFLGESIASAFDLYLVGRLLGRAPDAEFLATQVPAMADVCESAGVSESAFEAMLESIAADPDRAFEELRELLFDAATTLVTCGHLPAAAEAMEAFDTHRFAPLLHHYELSNWILYARAYAGAGPDGGRASEIDESLRAELAAGRSALDWLEKSWLTPPPSASILR
jgi:hypothetical protein